MKRFFLRRAAALLLSAVLCASAAGCGVSPDSSAPVSVAEITAAVTAAETETESAETLTETAPAESAPADTTAAHTTVQHTAEPAANTSAAAQTSAGTQTETQKSSETQRTSAATAAQSTVPKTETVRQTATIQQTTAASTAPATAAPETTPAPETTATETNPAGELPLSGIRIGIDPGHQRSANAAQETVAPWSSQTKMKVTGGCVGVKTGIAEYVTVLEISLKLREKLEALGAEVFLTRESHDVDLSNQERVKMLDAEGVALTLRIHADSSANTALNGFALYVSQSAGNAALSRQYAQTIGPVVCAATGAKNNGIIQNDNYTGMNWSAAPCIMAECGFMSNPAEDVLLNSADYQDRLAAGLADGIAQCFS